MTHTPLAAPIAPRHAALRHAIQAHMGITFGDLCSKERIRHKVYARFIYCHFASIAGDRITDMARQLGKNHSTIIYYLRCYEAEYKFNPKFRAMAQAVKSLLQSRIPS